MSRKSKYNPSGQRVYSRSSKTKGAHLKNIRDNKKRLNVFKKK